MTDLDPEFNINNQKYVNTLIICYKVNLKQINGIEKES
jgi:hypothetical protein